MSRPKYWPALFFKRHVAFILIARLLVDVLVGGAGAHGRGEVGPQGEENLKTLVDLTVVVPEQQAMYNGVKAFFSNYS